MVAIGEPPVDYEGSYANPNAIRKRILEYANRPSPTEMSNIRRGAIISNIDDVLKAIIYCDYRAKLDEAQKQELRDQRLLIMTWVTCDDELSPVPVIESSNDLSPQEMNGISRWMSKWDGSKWVWRRQICEEMKWVLATAQRHLKIIETAVASNEYIPVMADLVETIEPDLSKANVLVKSSARVQDRLQRGWTQEELENAGIFQEPVLCPQCELFVCAPGDVCENCKAIEQEDNKGHIILETEIKPVSVIEELYG